MKNRYPVAVAGAVLTVLVAGCADSVQKGPVESLAPAAQASATATSTMPPAPVRCVAPVVAIDPRGAGDRDSAAVAQSVKVKLDRDGYTVVVLKKSAGELVTDAERVVRARESAADLGVSIDAAAERNAVVVQRVGAYRGGSAKRPRAVDFTAAETAQNSQQYGKALARARSKAERTEVVVVNARAPRKPGTVPEILLLAEDIPWVYSEFGEGDEDREKLDTKGVETYARGVTAGIKSALPNRCK